MRAEVAILPFYQQDRLVTSNQMDAHPVILFDGVCNLCSGAVQFVIERDPEGHFRFASLQSEVGAELLRAHGLKVPEGDPDSIVLIEGGRSYESSGAALRIARGLSGLWWMLYAFIIVPAFLRDAVYRWVARNRYRWFGKSEECWVPTPDLRTRFLSAASKST